MTLFYGKVFIYKTHFCHMKEIHNLYLLAILGLLTIIALGITLDGVSSFGNFAFISSIILFFIGLFGLAFMVRKEK